MQAQNSHFGIQQIHLHSQSRLWTCKHNSHIMVFNNHIFIHTVPSVDMQAQQSHYGIQQIHLHSYSHVCGHANTTVTLWYSTNTSSFIQSRLWTCKHNSHIMVFNKYIFIHSVPSVDMQAQQSHYGIQQIHLHSFSHVCGHASTTVITGTVPMMWIHNVPMATAVFLVLIYNVLLIVTVMGITISS